VEAAAEGGRPWLCVPVRAVVVMGIIFDLSRGVSLSGRAKFGGERAERHVRIFQQSGSGGERSGLTSSSV
jgi:hypothetical protein